MLTWTIQVRPGLAENNRDLALLNLAMGSNLRGCDLVKGKAADATAPGLIKERASVLQSRTMKETEVLYCVSRVPTQLSFASTDHSYHSSTQLGMVKAGIRSQRFSDLRTRIF